MRLTLPRILAVVVVVLLIVGAVVLITAPGKYKVTALIPAANPSILEGSDVLVNGFTKGTVESLKPSGPGVEMELALDSDVAPLHAGAVVFVQWSSTVGDRLMQVNDGPKSNPEIPDGGRLEGNFPKPMEISDVLADLDPQTRARLAPLAGQLNKTLKGSEQDLNNTLRTAGPAFTALGNLVKGLAIDEPALTKLVNDSNALVSRIAARSPDVSGIVNDLSVSTRDASANRENLRLTLQKLPPFLDQAQSTLAKVPSTADATIPLLEDLKPATDRLPSVASNLAPVLRDLRPTIGELKPTLRALDDLLDETPSLLDQARSTIPKTTDTLRKLTPTVRDVRPFTPCVVGFLSGIGSVGSRNNMTPTAQNGQLFRVLVRAGPGSIPGLPVVGSNGDNQFFGTSSPRSCDGDGSGTEPGPFGYNGNGGAPAGLKTGQANPASSLLGGLN